MRARNLIATFLSAAMVIPIGPAQAGIRQPQVVSANPWGRTPHVLDGIVNALAQVGDTVIVGGQFSTVRNAGSRAELPRQNLFAFSLSTGRIDPRFAPRMDGPVFALAPGAYGTVYAGGSFTRGLVRLDLTDGSAVRSFTATAYGAEISSLVRHGEHLYVGGNFTQIARTARTALARLNASTGAVDRSFTVTPGGGETKITAMAVSHDRLVLDGSFTTLDGLPRPQLGVVDLTTGRVADWHTDAYAPECLAVFPSYVRGLDLSPDGSYFVVVTTGGPAPRTRKLCDTAARFETYAKGDKIRPTWVNHTGGDSLYSVAVTGAAIYVGGHQRWLDNPFGSDSAGKGAVSREGIGAIHPATGKALDWNPTRTRGIGVKAFLPVKNGLLVGSDTTQLGREYHARIGMFPMP